MEKRIFGYDCIRAIAVLLVMTGHTLGYVYSGTYSFFLSFLSGFLGVELFFVLSGALIGKLLIDVFHSKNYSQKLKNFILRRWFRTLPMYFIMLLVYWFGNRFIDAVQNPDVPLWKYFFFIQNFYHVQPTFFGVSWSLSVEEWFYVLFPLVLLIIKKGQSKLSTKKILFISIVIFLVYSLLMRFLALQEYHYSFYEGVRKIAFFRLDAIAFGILMAFGFHYFKDKISKNKILLFILGTVLLLVNQYLIFKDNYSNLNYSNTLYYSILGIGLMLIFPFFRELKPQNNSFGKGVLFISKISYSLYLIHWLVFKFLELSYFSFIPGVGKFVLFFILSFISACFTYYFIEKPILKYRDSITR